MFDNEDSTLSRLDLLITHFQIGLQSAIELKNELQKKRTSVRETSALNNHNRALKLAKSLNRRGIKPRN